MVKSTQGYPKHSVTLSVIGTGYVGLVTSACLANKGHSVICVDILRDKVSEINSGHAPFYEPGLDNLLAKVVGEGRLRATLDLEEAVLNSSVTIITVGTLTKDDHIDLSEVLTAVRQVALAITKKAAYHVIAIKSTVAPGTTDTIVMEILENVLGEKEDEAFGLCMNPEFLREGFALADFQRPDRIVIGTMDTKSFNSFLPLYQWADCPIIRTNLRTAEMIKYASNALLATLISYSNEIASISEGIGGIDIRDVFNGVHLDQRWTPFPNRKPASVERIRPGILSYLWPGCGYGGSCLPKDVQALRTHASTHGIETPLLDATISINAGQPRKMVLWAKQALGNLRQKKLTVLGLSFKPDTDDLRESPAITLVTELIREGARITVSDPKAMKVAAEGPLKGKKVRFVVNPREAIRGAHAVFLVTSWPEFKTLSKEDFLSLMATPCVIDGRLFFDGTNLKENGIIYFSCGGG